MMSLSDLLRISKKVNYNKSSGMDDLNSKLVLEAIESIPDIFVTL